MDAVAVIGCVYVCVHLCVCVCVCVCVCAIWLSAALQIWGKYRFALVMCVISLDSFPACEPFNLHGNVYSAGPVEDN